MKNLNRWMVGLDFSSTDALLIAYTSFLARHLKPQKIYFVHVQEAFEIPEEMSRYLPDTAMPTRESLRVKMEEQVRPYFKKQAQYACEVYEGGLILNFGGKPTCTILISFWGEANPEKKTEEY